MIAGLKIMTVLHKVGGEGGVELRCDPANDYNVQ